MRTAVIIPHKNDEERLAICLERLAQQTVRPDELLVVDNGSRNAANVAQVCGRYGAAFKVCPEGGSYRARNLGIESASAELLIFTDADCRPNKTFVSAYFTWAAGSPLELAAGPIRVVPRVPGSPTAWELMDMHSGYVQEKLVASGCAMTANLAVKRSAIERFGMFDARLYSSGDLHLTRLISSQTGGIAWVREARVDHPARWCKAQHVERMKRMQQGLAANRLNLGKRPVSLREMFRVLVPPIKYTVALSHKFRLSPLQVLAVFAAQSRLRLSGFRYRARLLSPSAVRRDGGKYA